LWLVFEQREFQRQAVLMLVDKAIYAESVGFHQRPRILVHRGEVAFRGSGKTECAKLSV
jgi:hypothetical protein